MRTRITFSPLAARSSASSAVKTTRPDGGARRGRQAAGDAPCAAPWDRGSDAAAGRARRARCARTASALVDQPLLHHVDGDLERRLGGALAGAGLQHAELAALHRELDVLHVAVMGLERAGAPSSSSAKTAGITSSIAGSWRAVGLLAGDGQMLRRADAGDHVLALGVDEELAVELVGAGRGVAGEGDAGGAIVAHIAEDHGLDVDRGAPVRGDVVEPAIGDGARRSSSCRRPRRWRPRAAPADPAGRACPAPPAPWPCRPRPASANPRRVSSVSRLDAAILLVVLEQLLEMVVVDAEHDLAVHLDEAAIAVIGEARVAGAAWRGPRRSCR